MNPYQRYIKLLEEELSEITPMIASPWVSSRIKEGESARDAITKWNPPRVGVAVVVEKYGSLLMGLRKNGSKPNTWGFPGGALEPNESIIECAARELFEETALIGAYFHELGYTLDTIEGTTWITFFIGCKTHGEPTLVEPHKCDHWKWISWDELNSPEYPLFTPLGTNLDKIKRWIFW